MMNKKRNLLVILVSLCLICIGFVGGTYFGWTKLGKATRSMERTFAMVGYSQYTVLEYQNANYPEAKKALLNYIAVLDEARKLKNVDFFDYRTYQVDTLLSYVRLAILENKRGESAESEKYMSEARKICQDVKWKDCSSNYIRQTVERLDGKLAEKK